MSNIIYYGTDIEKAEPEAFEALPECYQADSCLLFWKQDGVLFCRPDHDELAVLGDWICAFNPGDQEWHDPDSDFFNKVFPENPKPPPLSVQYFRTPYVGEGWILWLDDQMTEPEMFTRHCPPGYWGTSSFDAAVELVKKHGPPYQVDLDHDLGLGCPSGMDFLKWLSQEHYNSPPRVWRIHSANPNGKGNMISYLKSWVKSLNL